MVEEEKKIIKQLKKLYYYYFVNVCIFIFFWLTCYIHIYIFIRLYVSHYSKWTVVLSYLTSVIPSMENSLRVRLGDRTGGFFDDNLGDLWPS